jgi:hypothetical protein
MPPPKAEPLEELVLELTDLKFHAQDDWRELSKKIRCPQKRNPDFRMNCIRGARGWAL